MGFIWPAIQTEQDAKKVAREGAMACFFIGIVTSAVVVAQSKNRLDFFPTLGNEALIDAGIFVALGIGILLMSRIAAFLALLLYAYNQYYFITASGSGRVTIMLVIMSLFLLHAIRGTVSFHRFKKAAKEGAKLESAAAPDKPPQIMTPGVTEEPQKQKQKKKPSKLIFILILLGGLAVAGYFALPDLLEKVQSGEGISLPKDLDLNVKAMTSGEAFELKTGEVLRGNILQEDDEYIAIRSSDGSEHVILRSELAD